MIHHRDTERDRLEGSGFPYCRYLVPGDFFGTDFTDYAVWGE